MFLIAKIQLFMSINKFIKLFIVKKRQKYGKNYLQR